MKSTLALEFILRTIHFLQDLTLFPDLPIPANSSSLVQTQDPSSHISPMPPHSWEEKCESEGERGIKKLRFNLERKDWNLEKDYGEELIIVKSAYDQETKTNLLLTEAELDFSSDWVFGDLVNHTLDATADWNPDIKDYEVVQRLTDRCWVIHEATQPKLGGLFYSRDMVLLAYNKKMRDGGFISISSTSWPGLEPRENMVRAEMADGGGMCALPDPKHNTTKTLFRFVSTLDFKISLIPYRVIQALYVEGSRNYIVGLRKYQKARRQKEVHRIDQR